MYYKISNSYGEAFIKTTKDSVIITISNMDDKISIVKNPYPFRKQSDDIVTATTKQEFEKQAMKAFSLMV
jgi:hypothetical protein